jgi:hypothetical protein
MVDGLIDSISQKANQALTSVLSKVGSQEPGAPTQEQLDAIKDGQAFYEEAVKAQKPYLRIWYKSIAYYMGLQWLEWNESMNWLSEPVSPSWRVRMVMNLCMPTIRNRAAKILRSNPNFRMTAKNQDRAPR